RLLDAALALGRGHAAAEILLGHDVRGRLRPETGELDVLLLEGRPVLARDQRRAELPLDLVEGVTARNGEKSPHAEAGALLDDRVDDVLDRRVGARLMLCCARHSCLQW